MNRRLTALFIIIAISLYGPAVSYADTAPDSAVKAAVAGIIPEGALRIAESDDLVLYFNDLSPAVIIKDKRNGHLWTSYVLDSDYNMQGMNDTWRGAMNSLVTMDYFLIKPIIKSSINSGINSGNTDVKTTNPIKENAGFLMRKIENGISLHYDFDKLKISFDIDIRLDGDSVNVLIPMDSVKESGEYGIVYIRALPFLGRALDTDNGYVFYPDGCGALYNFKVNHSPFQKEFLWSIYGIPEADPGKDEIDKKAGIQPVMLPVFGFKKGDNAFLAIISEGEADTDIVLSPSGYVLEMNRVSPQFAYRRVYTATRPDGTKLQRLQEDIIRNDHAVRYEFLYGDEADYSGMANAYRDYLIKNGEINKVIKSGDRIPLGIDFLMGIKEERLIFDKFITMTTFSQAGSILDELGGKGVGSMQVGLEGWTKGGYKTFPLHLPPNRSLGGTRGLTDLADYTDKSNITLYLRDNFVDVLGGLGNYSVKRDLVHWRSGYVAYNKSLNRYLFNPWAAFTRFTGSFLPDAKRYAVNGIAFDKLGSLLYFDYNEQHTLTREEASVYWGRFLEESNKQFGSSAVSGGNAYVLKYAHRLYDIPVLDTGYIITDESVPFYQMVVHGSIPYTSDAGNLFYDPPKQMLQWVEYGCMPYYQLTYSKPDYLKYTEYSELFTSYYLDWLDSASEAYDDFNRRLGGTWGQYMVKHEKVADGVFKVTYANKTEVYINYTQKAAYADGYRINAQDYVVVDSRGEVVK